MVGYAKGEARKPSLITWQRDLQSLIGGVLIFCGVTVVSTSTKAEEMTSTRHIGYLEDELVCGFFKERFLGLLWSFLAGSANASRVEGLAGIEAVSFDTEDGRRLRGYKLKANGDPWAYILIGLGNAMLADHVMGEFQFLRDAGFDVYAFDYRGYGLSEGKSRFAALRTDFIALIQHLNTKGYDQNFVYGMSFGGILTMNALGADVEIDAALVDSAPSRVSGYGCPHAFDPVENLPERAAHLGFIFGAQDRVLRPHQWRELAEAARGHGATVLERTDFAHPLQDHSQRAWQARRDIIRGFFLEHVNRKAH
jgi:pimeloyl-ACP methyl ester carboxylesterase